MESVGSQLRQARVDRGLTIEDVAESTKITRGTLAAIEAGDEASLPAPVYFRGFVRAFAECVGLDPRKLLQAIDEASRLAAGDGSGRVRQRRTERHERDWFARLGGVDGETGRPAYRRSHLLLFLVAIGMLVTAWLTTGVGTLPQDDQAPIAPAIQERVDGVSHYTRADATRD